MSISSGDLSNIYFVVEFSESENLRIFDFTSSKPSILILNQTNDHLDFKFKEFILGPKQKNKVEVDITPKKVGTFRLISLFFSVFGIPRYFTLDPEFYTIPHFVKYVNNKLDNSVLSKQDICRNDFSHELTSSNCRLNRFLCT